MWYSYYASWGHRRYKNLGPSLLQEWKRTNGWRLYLNEHVALNEEGDACICFYEGLVICCETQRRKNILFASRRECITSIPGVDDPSSFSTWNNVDETLAVYEIIKHLLQWKYNYANNTWNFESASQLTNQKLPGRNNHKRNQLHI